MNRFIAIVLALLVILSACGSPQSAPATDPTQTSLPAESTSEPPETQDEAALEAMYTEALYYWDHFLQGHIFFYDPEAQCQVFDQKAWKMLYDRFTVLGDYRDSQDYLEKIAVVDQIPLQTDVLYYDREGNKVPQPPAIYEYDTQGNVTRIDNFDELNLLNSELHHLNLLGLGEQLVIRCTDNRPAEFEILTGSTVMATARIHYDDQGRRSGITAQTRDSSREAVYIYDEESGLLTQKLYDLGEQTRMECALTYDENGTLVREDQTTSFRGNTMSQAVVLYTYENGLLVQAVTERTDVGTVYGWVRYTVDYLYDNAGRLVHQTRSESATFNAVGDGVEATYDIIEWDYILGSYFQFAH